MNRITLIILTILLPICLRAQELQNFIGAYDNDNAQGYLQPVGDLLSSALFTGVWNTTPGDSGFHIGIGLSVSAAYVVENQRTFTGMTQFPFTPEQSAEAPTIVGATENVTVEGVNGTGYVFPGGFHLSYLPIVVPEISIGSFYGTDIHFRFLGFELGDDFGKFRQLGIGVQHKLTQYFDFWSDVYAGYYYQSLDIGDEVSGQFHQISVRAEKSADRGRYYLMAAYQPFNINFTYDEDDDEINDPVSVDLTADYPIHVELGGELKLSFFRLRAGVRATPPFGINGGINFVFDENN
ncbi:MAG TPA: DUF6588 family protein [Saprospiraceae bacterium]|nr:DUF6588 family protein [Saprospiraceae bacterium]